MASAAPVALGDCTPRRQQPVAWTTGLPATRADGRAPTPDPPPASWRTGKNRAIRLRPRSRLLSRIGGQFYEYTEASAGTCENDDRTLYLSYFDVHDHYSNVMVANPRGGRIEVVVPNVDGETDVPCVID